MRKIVPTVLIVALVVAAFPLGAAPSAPSGYDPPIVLWQPPATWTPGNSGLNAFSRAGFSGAAFSDISGPLPYVPISACRRYDSRNFTPLPNNTPRAVTLSGAPCGIPVQAQAVAVNITVFSITGAVGNGVFKVGNSSPPATAWINYPPIETQRGNAGVVPVTTNAVLYVQVNQGAGSVDFTVDVFGYYSNTPAAQQNYFELVNNSSNYTMKLRNMHASCVGACGLYATVTTGIAVVGESFNSVGVRGLASHLTGPGTRGVLGEAYSTADDTVGVEGVSYGTTGVSYGISGTSFSTEFNAAGVFGEDYNQVFDSGWATAGVRGHGVLGVVGVSTDALGGKGVVGSLHHPGGGDVSRGYLAYNATTGVYSVGDVDGTGLKSFVEPHPTDPTLVIKYVSLEGPEAGTYFRGTLQIRNGVAVITVPESFRIVTDTEGMTVQLTPVGAPANMYVVTEDLNEIVVRSNRDVMFHYMVNGIRRAYKYHRDIAATGQYTPQSPDDRMPLSYSAEAKQRLIANGTYNADGTVNMDTAHRVGWAKAWEDRKAAIEAAAAARREAESRPGRQNQSGQ